MKISTKGKYGLIALVDMAVYSENENISIGCIAKRQNISVKYLEQVFSLLRKADIVKSIKGAYGGYILAHKPSNIKIGTILRALEGDLSIIDEKTQENLIDSIQYCIHLKVYNKINEGINNIVNSITLKDLVVEYKESKKSENSMYYI